MAKHSRDYVQGLNMASQEPELDFREEFEKSSPRVKAILICSAIDLKLEQILSDFFRDDKKVCGEMFTGLAPLGTLSAKMKMTYLLKIVDKEFYQDLEIVRKVRNIFAHEVKGCDFEEKRIGDLISKASIMNIRKKISDKEEIRFFYHKHEQVFFLLSVFIETRLNRIINIMVAENRISLIPHITNLQIFEELWDSDKEDFKLGKPTLFIGYPI